MASANKSWGRFLWDEFKAIMVKPLDTDCELLSVLAKRPGFHPSESLLGSAKVVLKIGDIWTAGQGELSEDKTLKEKLTSFLTHVSEHELTLGDHSPFSSQSLPDIEEQVNNSSSLSGLLDVLSGAGKASAELRSTKSLTFKVEGVVNTKYKPTDLSAKVAAHEWEPDLKNRAALLNWSASNNTLWIINEVYYAESISVSANDNRSAQANITGAPGTVTPVTFEISASRERDAQRKASITRGVGKPLIPFAFKALAFTFDKDGKIKSILPASGGRRLKKRNTTLATDPEDPMLNMGGLFYSRAEEDDEGKADDELEIFPIYFQPVSELVATT